MKKILILIPIIVTSFHISGMNDRSRSNSPTNSSRALGSRPLTPEQLKVQEDFQDAVQRVNYLEKQAESLKKELTGFSKVGPKYYSGKNTRV